MTKLARYDTTTACSVRIHVYNCSNNVESGLRDVVGLVFFFALLLDPVTLIHAENARSAWIR